MSQFTVFSACFSVSALIANKTLKKCFGLVVCEKVTMIQLCADEQLEHKHYEVCQRYEPNSIVKAQGNVSFHVFIVEFNKKDCCPYAKKNKSMTLKISFLYGCRLRKHSYLTATAWHSGNRSLLCPARCPLV